MNQISLETLLAVITAYGATVTKLVDALRKSSGAREDLKWLWGVLALVLGLVVAFVFDVNVLTGPRLDRHLGQFLTGLAIGAAGSGWHEVFDALSGVAKATRAQSVPTRTKPAVLG